MHYAILAAGEGSRLNVVATKPLAPIQGRTLIGRLLDIIAQRDDAQSVVAVINSRKPEIRDYLGKFEQHCGLKTVSAHTLSAAHSLILALEQIPAEEPVVALTVDTVFLAEEFNRYVDDFKSMTSADVLMGVTRYADDEKPLYVEVDGDMRIRAFHDFKYDGIEYVSAGVYGIGRRARQALTHAVSVGVNGLREVQRSLLLQGVDVKALEFSKVFDVDCPHNLLKAREFLMENEIWP